MIADQATADYAVEQGKLENLRDSQGTELELNRTPEPEPTYPESSQCAQCVNWHPTRKLYRADSSTVTSPGFCSLRAAANLKQMSQDYAGSCRFFTEEIPF